MEIVKGKRLNVTSLRRLIHYLLTFVYDLNCKIWDLISTS